MNHFDKELDSAFSSDEPVSDEDHFGDICDKCDGLIGRQADEEYCDRCHVLWCDKCVGGSNLWRLRDEAGNHRPVQTKVGWYVFGLFTSLCPDCAKAEGYSAPPP